MRVAFLQTRPVFADIEGNVEWAVKKILSLDADLVVLPELFSTGYQFRSRKETLKLSETVHTSYACKRLAEAARDKGTHIVAGIAERSRTRTYNSSVLVTPGGVAGVYRKAHLFGGEKKCFSPGNTPFEVYEIGGLKVGMMICFDWFFPEAARTLALKGAEVICHPSNLVLPYCPAAMITRSLENMVFSITANRVGTEERVRGERLRFIGSSQIVSPQGDVLLRAGRNRPGAGIVEIDPREARKKKLTPENDIFKDRRRDLYDL